MLGSPAQQALVATLFLKAIHAWEGYRRAFEQHRRMVDELKQQLVPYADGAFAITRARRVEALLLDDYVQKLSADRFFAAVCGLMFHDARRSRMFFGPHWSSLTKPLLSANDFSFPRVWR